MPALADLIGRDSTLCLAAARRQAERHQAQAEAAPVQPATCQSCGQALPTVEGKEEPLHGGAVPLVVFRSGAEHQAPPPGAERTQTHHARARG